jgi:hypothetical protein
MFRIKIEISLFLAVVFMGVELPLIVQKKYHIIRVCEKSVRGSAMPRREGWKKLHNGNSDNVLLFI